MTPEFDELERITALLEEQALDRHRAILSRETGLRRELEEIEKLRFRALRLDDQSHTRRMLGADSLWQGWLAERRMRLNQDLAMLQVRKAESHSAADTAFARHQVTAELARDHAEVRRRKRIALTERRLEEGFQMPPDEPGML